MERLKLWFIKNRLEIMLFTGIFILFFWRLGAIPEVLDQNIDVGIHPQVNKVLDNMVTPGEITWLWQDMHQFEAGRSPLYGGLIEAGLRLFGLTLFGIRIFPAILSFLVLILLYWTLIQFFPRFFSWIFIILFSSSPWYLTLARSGGFVGFSLNLGIIALCLVALLIKKEGKGIILPVLAGISTALLPYGYVILRPLIPVLVLLALFSFRRVKSTGLIMFLISFFAVVSIQLIDLQGALDHFFFARGESSYSVFVDYLRGEDVELPVEHLLYNLSVESKLLLGLNHPENYWNPPLAVYLCAPDEVLYPKFLAPFFILGFFMCFINFIRKKTMRLLAPILFFFLAVFPGTIGSAIGGPCMGRDTLAIIPLYFFISYAIFQIFSFALRQLELLHFTKINRIMTGVLIGLMIVISGYQIYNYYSLSALRGERALPAISIHPFVTDYFNQNPDANMLIQEFAPDRHYGAYAFIRLLGGKSFQEKVNSGQITFVRNENMEELDRLIKNNHFDIVVAGALHQLVEEGLPVLAEYQSVAHEGFHVIHLK